MTTYFTRRTPDYSPLVVHFTKDGDRPMVRTDLIQPSHPLFQYQQTVALDRLISILTSKTIHASPMPFLPNNPQAVCFTECIWDALVDHTDRYSPFGIVFSKRLIYERGGGPALYIRGDTLKSLIGNLPTSLEPFIAPFDPQGVLQPGVRLNFLHEREWRLPKSLMFEYSDVEYVIVESIDNAAQVVHQIGAQRLPEDKLIPIEVYRNIRTAWREH